jgi:hypothetical protein
MATNGQRERRYEIYVDGELVSAFRAATAREAAKEFLANSPSVRSCTIGLPGESERWGFAKSEKFDENPNRMTSFDPKFTGLF